MTALETHWSTAGLSCNSSNIQPATTGPVEVLVVHVYLLSTSTAERQIPYVSPIHHLLSFHLATEHRYWTFVLQEQQHLTYKRQPLKQSHGTTYRTCSKLKHTHRHNHFTALFPGPPAWAGARRELLDFMVQGEINRGSHRPAGWAPLHLD